MNKHQKALFLRNRRWSIESKDDAPAETPPNDAKIRLLLSEYPHDSRFVFKTQPSKYDEYFPRKHEQDLSFQHFQEKYKPDISPEIFKANKAMMGNTIPSPQSLKNTATSLSPLRRRGCFLNPTTLPKPQVKVKVVKNEKMKDLVRRKSCHCSDCGGLSKLEKKTMHLPAIPIVKRAIRLPIRDTSRKSSGKSPLNGAHGRRTTVASGPPTKKKEVEEPLTNQQLLKLKMKKRSKSWDGPKTTTLLLFGDLENFQKDRTPYVKNRSPKSKPTRKATDRFLIKRDPFSQSVGVKGFAATTKSSTPQLRKIQIKRKAPSQDRGGVLTLNTEHNLKTYCVESKPSSHNNSKKNLPSDRVNSEVTERPSFSTVVSKDIHALKNLLTPNLNSSKSLKTMPSERSSSKVSTFGLSMRNASRKQSPAPPPQSANTSRPSSLPKVTRETHFIIQKRNAEAVSGSQERIKTVDRDRSDDVRNRVWKLPIKNKSQLEMLTARPETQTSRELRVSIPKKPSNNEIWVQNMRLTLEADKFGDRSYKKKKKRRPIDTLWKDYMQSALLQYQDFRKIKGGNGSSLSHRQTTKSSLKEDMKFYL